MRLSVKKKMIFSGPQKIRTMYNGSTFNAICGRNEKLKHISMVAFAVMGCLDNL